MHRRFVLCVHVILIAQRRKRTSHNREALLQQITGLATDDFERWFQHAQKPCLLSHANKGLYTYDRYMLARWNQRQHVVMHRLPLATISLSRTRMYN